MMAILGRATQTGAALAQVTSNAAVGASATMASISAIPIVGPGLAPEAGAAMYAGILGTYGPLASASGGWERVPQNTLTMLHTDEKVLPASVANAERAFFEKGGNAGSGDTHLHIHGGVDSKAFFQQNQGNIMATIRDAMKNRRS